MNTYRLIALTTVLIIAVHLFHADAAVTSFMKHIFDIPQFSSYGSNAPLFKLCVRGVYLITIVGIIKLIVGKKGDSE